MAMENNTAKSGGNSGQFFKGIFKILCWSGGLAWTGFKQIKFRSEEFLIVAASIFLVIFAITFGDYAYLKCLHFIWPSAFTPTVVIFLRRFARAWHFVLLLVLTSWGGLMAMGVRLYFQRRRFQKDLDTVGLRNAQGKTPKVVHAIAINESKSKLIIKCKGIGVDKFEAKRGDLEFSFGQIVEGVTASADRQTISILLCKKELTRMLHFGEVVALLKKPYSFVVGESVFGLIVQELRELPHLLIAGSTGGGKSFFFRQLLVCLLRTSPRMQMYLIDLKRGVEVKEFSQLPNVRVAKDEMEAVQVLKKIREEMHRRFVFMEQKGIKRIEPSVHKMDLIVLAVDEASVLYGKVSSQSSKKEIVAEARELTDELAKLARAAAIHIIMATQKAVKESLDTKTLENLNGRIAFKMSTHAGSNTALGNVDAYALPDIKGRAIWNGGNKFLEVQTPFLSEEELDIECKVLAEKMAGDEGRCFGPMLDVSIENKEADTNINTLVTVKKTD